jgi:hypothetical protein
MPQSITLGSARATPGQLAYGRWLAFEHPTGTPEELPVILAQGYDDGPTFWLTANIHGPELTGIAVIHELVTADLAKRLHGTLVCIPSLSPAGFRIRNREPYFDPQDPNRLFPDAQPRQDDEKDTELEYPTMQEQVWARLFEEIRQSADYLIDLHNAQYQSIPFSIRDKAYYRREEDRAPAEELQARTGRLSDAFGLPSFFEFSRKKFLKQKLQRSMSGAAFHLARIPAFTTELGAPHIVDPDIVTAAVNGLHNCLVHVGMLDAPLRPVNVPRIESDMPLRRETHPRAPATGLIRHRVRQGQRVQKGDIIATLNDIYGRPIGEGVVRTEYDGWIIGLTSGLGVYQNAVLCTMAVRDDEPLVMKWDE